MFSFQNEIDFNCLSFPCDSCQKIFIFKEIKSREIVEIEKMRTKE
jgi:hypothetical protein